MTTALYFSAAVMAAPVSYTPLTYERMEKSNIFVEGEDKETLKEFETVKIMATFKASPYAYTKKWFLEKYKDFAREAEQGEAPSANAELAVVA